MICPPIPYYLKERATINELGRSNILDVYGGYLSQGGQSQSHFHLYKLVSARNEKDFVVDLSFLLVRKAKKLSSLTIRHIF
jgi:hypothetical protein